MIKRIKKIIFGLLLLLILLICTLSFFLSTTPGLYTAIKISAHFLPGTLRIHHISGRLLDKFSIGELEYQSKNAQIKIRQLKIDWHFISIIQHQLPIHSLKAKIIEIEPLETAAIKPPQPTNNSGTFKVPLALNIEKLLVAELKIKHPHFMQSINKIKLSAQINQDSLQIKPMQFNYSNQKLALQLQMGFMPLQNISGQLLINPKIKNPEIITGRIDLGGDLDQLQWSGKLNGPTSLSIEGTLKQKTAFNQIIKWHNVQWRLNSKKILKSPQGRLKIIGNLPELNLELSTKVNTSAKTNWQMNATAQGSFPWHWNFETNLVQPLAPSSKAVGLFTSFTAKGTIRDKNRGTLTLIVHPGRYQMPVDAMIPSLLFKGGTLDTSLSPKELTGEGILAIDENKSLRLQFKLPQFDLSKGILNTQPISGSLSLVLNSLDFLQNISPQISHSKGQLTAALKAQGTLGNMQIESKLKLSKTSINLPKLGVNLDAIDFLVIGKNKHWEANGFINSANKKIILKGQGPLSSELSGDLTLQGTDFPIINTQEYQIHISPQLNLKLSPSILNISGTILVPYAQVRPQTFTNSLTLSDDVIYKVDDEVQPSILNTSMDVQVEMGNQVELTLKGLHALLEGKVHVKQVSQGPITGTGELLVKKGEYKAYGQDLAVEQGQLLFTGGRLDNPGINLRASKNIDNNTTNLSSSNQLIDFNSNNLQNVNMGNRIKVGVEVTGQLTAPKIQLFSIPSILSQADILSMLVLGKPANQANKAGGQLLLTALSSMNLGTGTNGAQLIEELKESLGFDFNVQTNTNYNKSTQKMTDSTGFVVGKSLSKRLYLSYNVGLSQADPNVLTLKYLLNKFLSIQVSSSDSGNGIDFLYTSQK